MGVNQVGYQVTVAGETVYIPPPDPVELSLSAPLEVTLTAPTQLTQIAGTNNYIADPDEINLSLSASEVGKDITYTGGNVVTPFARTITFKVDNEYTAGTRKETIRASVPFSKDQVQPSDLDNLIVSGHETAWLPLSYWPGGSIKIAQAQFTDTLDGEGGDSTKTYALASSVGMALQGTFQRHPSVTGLDFGAEVHDTYDTPYLGFASGSGEVLQSTPLVETKFYRTYHEVSAGASGIQRDGNPRDYLASNFYVTEFRDMPIAVVDWIIANDYLGADSPSDTGDPNLYPLGAIDVNNAYFLASGMQQVYAYRAGKDNLVWASTRPTGHIGWRGLNNTYIGDNQTRRFRFILRWYVNNSEEHELAKRTATAIQQYPMFPMASRLAWSDASAAGLVGGPREGPADANARAQSQLNSFESNGYHFGTWGIKGLPLDTNQGGTPINGPLTEAFAHALQGDYPKLLTQVEQLAWAHSVRPFHYHGLKERDIGDNEQFQFWAGKPEFRVGGEKLGRQVYADNAFSPQNWPYYNYKTRIGGNYLNANGPNAWDAEHFSCDFMFDYYNITGDAWAKDAIATMATQGKGCMKTTNIGYFTELIFSTRAEGLVTQAWAQAYLVTQNEGFRDYAMRRCEHVHENRTGHESGALQLLSNGDLRVYWPAGYPWPDGVKFYVPWQWAHVTHGYLGAYENFEASAGASGTSALLDIVEDFVGILDYGWVSGVFDTNTQQTINNGLRYYVFTEGPSAYGAASQSIPASGLDWVGPGGNAILMDQNNGFGGTGTFIPAPLQLLANATDDSGIRNQALSQAGIMRGTVSEDDKWNRWWYCRPPGY